MKSGNSFSCFFLFASVMGNDAMCKSDTESCSVPEDEVNLMQFHSRVKLGRDECPQFSKQGQMLKRTSLSVQDLVCTESHFAHKKGESAAGHVGGDRMNATKHNYAPSYAKHITSLLTSGSTPSDITIVEVGILTGSGLAMWQHLFPESSIFGFDLNTDAYSQNLDHLKSLGMQDSSVSVVQMNQMFNNTQMLLDMGFGDKFHPVIMVDDGYHVPAAGEKTFLTFQPFLADSFAYFIEDVTKESIEAGEWVDVKTNILKACPSCNFAIECPPVSHKPECLAVITKL